ncbi:ABC transporter substrate-binding protein [Candidatus Bipolaricaulota bacterium]|nr:ABC transporter substrate-binding protein [Candidatus Bipolaricaulota bacterium]
MRTKARFLCLAVVISGLLFGLTTTGLAQDKSILRIGFSWTTFIDPAVASDYSSSSAVINLYDTLVYPTPEGDVVPHAAKSWEVSSDNLTYTFKLRKGIKFHDGSELTAEDVKFTMDRLLEIGEGYAYLYRGKVDSAKVVDKYTVQLVLKQPYGPFLSSLIRFYLMNEDVVMANTKPGPYGDFGDYGKEYLLSHDAGSGAYMVKEFPFEEYLLMERFPEYWGEVAPNAADEVKFLRSPDPVTIVTMMSRRELEITDAWQPEESYQTMARIEGVDIAQWENGAVYYLMLNNKRPPTDDIHFRKALSWVLDYGQIITSIFPGTTQAHGPVAHATGGYKEGLFQYTQDLDKAREELQKSKYYDQLDEMTVVFAINVDVPALEKVGLLFQANADEIGINVELVKMPWGKIVEVVADPDENPHVMPINVAPHYPEAGSMIESKYHSKTAGTWEQAEWVDSHVLDQLIDDALATVDIGERYRKYGLIQEIAVELAPTIFLFELFEKHAYQAAYVDWPQLEKPVPVMGYNNDCRFIEVFPDRIP